MTVRKNFVFDDEVAEHLKEIAKKRKLEALNRISGSATRLFGDLTVQEIKANIDV
jgi:uncharacterized Fe-S cluster-containing radical SAM superfamily protein